MSDPDSFINEVTEEVRRDRMVGVLRKNAIWIGLAIVLIIGTASVLEWRRASTKAAAETRGDAILAAMDIADPAARAEALGSLEMGTAEGTAVVAITEAAALTEAGDGETAATLLSSVASDGQVSPLLRDIARLKLVGIPSDSLSQTDREDLLTPMLQEGHALRSLALEQRAFLRLANGDRSGAVSDLESITDDPRASEQVRNRADQFLAILAPGAATDG